MDLLPESDLNSSDLIRSCLKINFEPVEGLFQFPSGEYDFNLSLCDFDETWCVILG